jgi:hypothetical protein
LTPRAKEDLLNPFGFGMDAREAGFIASRRSIGGEGAAEGDWGGDLGETELLDSEDTMGVGGASIEL